MLKTYEILVSGQVQGVGFRPYVFALATALKLKGTVFNNETGVMIKLTGEQEKIVGFYDSLIKYPPPVSRIEEHSLRETPFVEYNDFKIIPSSTNGNLNLRLTPDFALCESCSEDLNNPDNRRSNYAFTTCINCGPRWAITQKFPFDRENTSMTHFEMCNDCLKEYTDAVDRRFHSQTNSCKTCGIELSLWDNQKNKIQEYSPDLFKLIANYLKDGKIIAIKNTSGYLLCCHAEESMTVKRLRELKKRPRKPFAVLYPSLEKLREELPITQTQLNAFKSPERPIVILPVKDFKGKIALTEVAPGLSQLGVMLPYTGILQLLAQELNFPIIATSGNLRGSPVISDSEEAFEKLPSVADYFIQHNLNIEHPQDDSVLKISFKREIPVLLRRSRGYAPNLFVTPPKSNQKIMAMGADLKSTLSFLPNNHFYTSQYLGNLENYDVYHRFTKETESLIQLFDVKPEVVLTDKHPGYFSTSYGKEVTQKLKIKEVSIQHHKAHFASVLGEHELFDSDEKILGVVWDGTGYGDDGQIWGGEFFEYYSGQIERKTHFEYFDWLAGDKMSKEPRLSLLSLCDEESVLKAKFSEAELKIYRTLKKKNRLKTSSVGRLFDAVASLINLCDYNSYEGEASILLENSIKEYDISKSKSYYSATTKNTLAANNIIENILIDLTNKVPKPTIAANFIFTLAMVIVSYAESKGYKTICCSGGVFQNTTLIDMISELSEGRFTLHFNQKLAPNDENISFGQAMYYLYCSSS